MEEKLNLLSPTELKEYFSKEDIQRALTIGVLSQQ
jgi:hypothetical protein